MSPTRDGGPTHSWRCSTDDVTASGGVVGATSELLGDVTNSWLNRIETQFTALRYCTLGGTDHEQQSNMIHRYTI